MTQRFQKTPNGYRDQSKGPPQYTQSSLLVFFFRYFMPFIFNLVRFMCRFYWFVVNFFFGQQKRSSLIAHMDLHYEFISYERTTF